MAVAGSAGVATGLSPFPPLADYGFLSDCESTALVETSWGTPTGWLVVRDVLLIGPWHHEGELSRTHRRAPTDYDADHVLLRTVRCVTGEVQVVVDCEPMFDYGRRGGTWAYNSHGYHSGTA